MFRHGEWKLLATDLKTPAEFGNFIRGVEGLTDAQFEVVTRTLKSMKTADSLLYEAELKGIKGSGVHKIIFDDFGDDFTAEYK